MLENDTHDTPCKAQSQSLLSIRCLTAGYEGSVVLNRVSLEVYPNELVCLLGSNGAGKTTLLAVVAGLVAPTSGQITFEGRDLIAVPPYKRVATGVALCPEGRKLFSNLDVEEYLILGSFHKRARAGRRSKLSDVYEIFPLLAERRRQKAGLMSGGEQQMLAIGRALMSDPRLLLLDEPSLGLSPLMVEHTYGAIRRIAAAGTSILLVEQNTTAALSVARRGYLLSVGHIVDEDTTVNLQQSDRLQKAFMGVSSAGSEAKC